MKERLDIFLYKKGFVDSRSKAQQLIKGNYVSIDGIVQNKSGFFVDENSNVQIKQSPFIYVGRAGVKLKYAIDNFNIDLTDKVCLDIGSSTGGFSDCMLQQNAGIIYAVDVGKNQLHESLRNNPKIILFENTDIRSFKTHLKFDFIAVDVSFISLKHVLPYAASMLKDNSEIAALIKPQFEAGPGVVRKGVVTNQRIVENVLDEIRLFCKKIGLNPIKTIKSPIRGKEGNVEYLIYIKKLQ